MSSRKSHLLVRLALSDQEYWLLHLNDPTLETRTLEVFYWPRKSFNWQSYKISIWQVLQKSDFDVIYLNFWSNIALRGQNEASSFFLSEDIFLKIDLMKCGSIKKICWNVWKSFCYLYSKGWTQKLILPLLLVWDPLVPLTLFAPAYLSIFRWGGGTLNVLGLDGVRVLIIFGNDLLWNDLPYYEISVFLTNFTFILRRNEIILWPGVKSVHHPSPNS